MGLVEDRLPSLHHLPRIGRPEHRHVGHGAHGGQVFDGLMGGPVLPQENRLVGEDPDRWDVHESGQPDGGAHVVAEDEEGGPVGSQPAVEGEAVDDGAHGVLAHPEMHVPARGILAGEAPTGRQDRLGRSDEVGGPTDQSRYLPADLVEDGPDGPPGGETGAYLEARPFQAHPLGRVVARPACLQPRVGCAGGPEPLLPADPGGAAPVHPGAEVLGHATGNVEVLVRPARAAAPPGDLVRS